MQDRSEDWPEMEQVVPVPSVGEGFEGQGHFAAFGKPWVLGQGWRSEPESGLQRGTVSLGWDRCALWVVAELPDAAVFSHSEADNQKLWELGDVCEIFLQRRRQVEYLELHVSPNGHQAHWRWTEERFAKVREGHLPLAECLADARAFTAEVRDLTGEAGWGVRVRIPAGVFAPGLFWQPGEELWVSCSRYDADAQGRNAILSSTSPHRKPSFHRRDEWRMVRLVEPGGELG